MPEATIEAETNALPAHLTPEQRIEALKHILELNGRIRRAGVVFADATDAAKAAKKHYEGLQKDLGLFIAGLEKPMPLFDGKAESNGQAAEDGSWREEDIEAIGLEFGLPASVASKLAEAGIVTLGQLADWTASGKELNDIPGIGDAKCESINAALERFWAARKIAAGEPEGEDAA